MAGELQLGCREEPMETVGGTGVEWVDRVCFGADGRRHQIISSKGRSWIRLRGAYRKTDTRTLTVSYDRCLADQTQYSDFFEILPGLNYRLKMNDLHFIIP